MIRTKLPPTKIPDAINCSRTREFTQIPNSILRDPDLSSKAKIVLCILLSNREGWKSCIPTLQTMMKEGRAAIINGIQELKNAHYLCHFRYRHKDTKIIQGLFWAYTDTPGDFYLQPHVDILHQRDLEIVIPKKQNKDNHSTETHSLENHNLETGSMVFPKYGKPAPNNTNIKNTNIKKTNIKTSSDSLDLSIESSFKPSKKITTSMFEQFWELYPRKTDKGKALTSWGKLCNRKDCPSWSEIKTALLQQIQTERWQDATFIPMPTTWLNQQRWLDDPSTMKSFKTIRPNVNRIGHVDKDIDLTKYQRVDRIV
jgi:hypothetical protein